MRAASAGSLTVYQALYKALPLRLQCSLTASTALSPVQMFSMVTPRHQVPSPSRQRSSLPNGSSEM